MKKIFRIFTVLFFFGLANCSDLKKGLGFDKDVPDEFLIKTNDPLKKPPSFDLLPPDSKNEKITTSKKSSDDNIKSIIDNSLNKNLQNSKKNETKVESQSDLENTILKELSK
jgi:hypothetical protein